MRRRHLLLAAGDEVIAEGLLHRSAMRFDHLWISVGLPEAKIDQVLAKLFAWSSRDVGVIGLVCATPGDHQHDPHVAHPTF
ncbi:MAG: hypothetical protein H0T46_32690 [Deltaproteobacteria bacterium]|nr:hypothetical protein [Deltaproteobacteria bacterium]